MSTKKTKTIQVTLELPESLIALLRTSFKIRGDRLKKQGSSEAILRRYAKDPPLDELLMHSLSVCAGMVMAEIPPSKHGPSEF